jgi:hypothetical protein
LLFGAVALDYLARMPMTYLLSFNANLFKFMSLFVGLFDGVPVLKLTCLFRSFNVVPVFRFTGLFRSFTRLFELFVPGSEFTSLLGSFELLTISKLVGSFDFMLVGAEAPQCSTGKA